MSRWLAGLRLLQTKTYRRRRAALRRVRRAAARTEYRHQGFASFTAHSAISLNSADIDAARSPLIALIAFVSGRTLRALRSLGTGLSLSSRNPLQALRTLGARRTLRPGITLRAGIPAASGQRNSDAHDEHWKNSHAKPPESRPVDRLRRQPVCL
jgi:hypothetical protein